MKEKQTFRELPLILQMVKKLDALPDLYMFDGNGYLHPRHMGIATHASFYLDKPTMGVAKNYYKIDDVDCTMPPNERNAYTDIVIKGEVYGCVLRTLKNVKPIYVSIGNDIDLNTATDMVCDFINSESHIPLPTRLAEIDVKDNMFHIHKINKELQSYDLFEQIILFRNLDNLLQSITGQLLPRIWTQGDSKCAICRPNEEKIVCVFYDTQMDAKDNYFYAKRLCDELSTVFN